MIDQQSVMMHRAAMAVIVREGAIISTLFSEIMPCPLERAGEIEVACLLYPEALMRRKGEVLLPIVTGSPRLPQKTQDVRNDAALCCLNN